MALLWASLFAGLLFGTGLTVSQMIDPAKVIGFLDFAGNWDPTLAFVMGGALAVTIPGFMLVRRMGSPLVAHTFQLPTRRDIDSRLIGGAALFGIGWGLAGFCPGPALSALVTGVWQVAVFVAAMVAGMLAVRFITK